jgi:hypothetical protein
MKIDPTESKQLLVELAQLLFQAVKVRPLLPDVIGLEEGEDHTRTKNDPVFTGGCIVSLLITDAAAPPPSWTKDIDAVLEIKTYHDFSVLERSLEKAGFTRELHDKAGIFAWQWKEVRVDILPSEPNELFSSVNTWFPALLRDAELIEITQGKYAWIASAPCFIATKLEAFFNRGKGDYLASKDIEDIIAVVDGRKELFDEMKFCDPTLKDFVSRSFREFLSIPAFRDAVVGSVGGEGREPIVFERLDQIASL